MNSALDDNLSKSAACGPLAEPVARTGGLCYHSPESGFPAERAMKKRHCGIDLLRLIAITGVVVLHTLLRSGLLSSDVPSQYAVAWLLEIMCFFSVDCFGMISGYVNYSEEDKPLKVGNYVELWLQVVFYGIVSVGLFACFSGIDIKAKDVSKALMPLITGEYWFFSAYTGMFFLSRLINAAVRRCDNKTLAGYLFAGLFLFSFLESVAIKVTPGYSVFYLGRGFSCAWLSLMYFTGAVVRKTKCNARFGKKFLLLAMLLAVLSSWVWLLKIGPALSSSLPFGRDYHLLFVEYVSPTIVLVAAGMLMLFANTDFSKTKILNPVVSWAAPSAFSVYLLNSQPLIAAHLYNKEHLAYLLSAKTVFLIPAVLGTCILFALACICIDKARLLLFRFCRIKEFAKKIESLSRL